MSLILSQANLSVAADSKSSSSFSSVLESEQSRSGGGLRLPDTLVGTDRSEKLRATSGNDQVRTGAGTDRVITGKGNDRIIVDGSGDKDIRAGRGTDTVELAGSSNDYSITNSGKTTIYTGPDGSRISIRGAEQVFFAGSKELQDVGERTPVPTGSPVGQEFGDVDPNAPIEVVPSGDDESPLGRELADVDPGAPIEVVPSDDDESPLGREFADVDPNAPIEIVPSEDEPPTPIVPTDDLTVAPISLQLGTEGDDVLIGSDRNDILYGRAGNDVLNGGAGNDDLNGGAGDDVIDGGKGDDTLTGAAGNDDLRGGQGNDLAVLEGRASSYEGSVETVDGKEVWTLTNTETGDTTTLTDIENVRFQGLGVIVGMNAEQPVTVGIDELSSIFS